MSTKVRINENKTKQKVFFLFCIVERKYLRDTVSKVHIFLQKYPIFSKNSVWCNFYMKFNIS